MRSVVLLVLLLVIFPTPAPAEFGIILPADEIVSQGDSPLVSLQLRLFDPSSRRFPELAKPKRFGVQHLGEETDLLATLRPGQQQPPTSWDATFTVKHPGDYLFYAETTPRWEAEEEQFIVHHAKLCLNAFGLEEGWDEPIGAAAEIIPLSRPYGLWTSNLFSGQILVNGEPAPYVAVEIAYLGSAPEGAPLAGTPYRVQTVRADAGGVFHYAMPRAGWWGFAVTVDVDWTIKRDGVDRPVSLVASSWVRIQDMP